MVSNSYNSNAYGTMPVSTVGTADTNPNFMGNIPPSADTFAGSSPKKDDEKKEGKNWVPHWLATGLSFVGGIGASIGIDHLISKSTSMNPKAKLIASCLGGAATGFGFEWFRQENNEGKISQGSLAMNTVLNTLPFGYLLNKMRGKPTGLENAAATQPKGNK